MCRGCGKVVKSGWQVVRPWMGSYHNWPSRASCDTNLPTDANSVDYPITSITLTSTGATESMFWLPLIRKFANCALQPSTPQFQANTVLAQVSFIACSECDGTRAETRFGLSAKRTSPLNLWCCQFSRGVRISGSNGSNAGYTVFWGRVQDCWLPTPLAYSPFNSPTVRHRVPSGFNWALLL